MRHQGKITTWKDDRGFGFITPSGAGATVFVHISALNKGQRRPSGNEVVTYELINDPQKGLRAQNVMFFGAFQPSMRTKWRHTLIPIITVLLLAGIAIYALQHRWSGRTQMMISHIGAEEATQFKCQGKQYCSEMTSCEEAMFYLKHCPGVKIDGDHDGIPCESQLCGH